MAAYMTRAGGDKLGRSKRLVVKIGSALLVEQDSGAVRRPWLTAMARDIAELRAEGVEVIVVSSGAVAVGRRRLGLPLSGARLEEKQAAAACGQARLAHAYQEAMAVHGVEVAQMLLTLDDTERRRHYLNARSTLHTLLRVGAMPVINENDTVATQEIRFGDNDRLAARVAMVAGADALVLLSDIDGLYTADPGTDPAAILVPEVTALSEDIMAMAGDARSEVGAGGMATKLAAAAIAMTAGCAMAIARGVDLHPLKRLRAGGPCTWFVPRTTPRTARKQWISGALKTHGALTLDDGAVKALAAGKSLLPAGVVRVSGDFDRGDAVEARSLSGAPLGKGLTAYSSRDARAIIGRKSAEIEAILGYRGREELIHRDDLVVDHLERERMDDRDGGG